MNIVFCFTDKFGIVGSTVCGATVELGRHEWFALRRLITNSGVSETVFFKVPHKWTEKRRTGYSMDHCGTETLQPTSQFKMADRLTQSPLSVAQHCSVLVFPLQKCWDFILRNKAFVYLLYLKKCDGIVLSILSNIVGHSYIVFKWAICNKPNCHFLGKNLCLRYLGTRSVF